MLGLSIQSRTATNQLHLEIPDELKNKDLQIIILPVAASSDQSIDFISEGKLAINTEFNNDDIKLFDKRRERRLNEESKVYSWEDAKDIVIGKRTL